MLVAYLVDTDGKMERGGEELIERWRAIPGSRIWVDLNNLSELEEDRVVKQFGLHPLALSDARRVSHPPKMEMFDDHLFILLRGLDADTTDLEFGTMQLAMFAGADFLVSRHVEKSVSLLQWQSAPELARILRDGGVRLALEISATVARRYLDLLAEFEPRLTELEDELQDNPGDGAMRELTRYRTRLRKLRRIFNYHTRLFENLRKEEKNAFFNPAAKEFRHRLMDVYEKYERLQSLSTMHYELAGDLVEGYISLTNHALNNTMRILTALTAIFVPLTFVAGIYGMNFEYMPELSWRWGYFFVLGAMLVVIVVLITLFRRIRWL